MYLILRNGEWVIDQSLAIRWTMIASMALFAALCIALA